MKLSVRDAAKLLNTSERTIYRWIREGAIPCHRVNDHYGFHRAELLEWATARGISIYAEAVPFSRRFDAAMPELSSALRAGGIHYQVEGNDRESVLRAIVKRMPLNDESERELLRDVMLAREALGSTGVGDGIAIPHVRTPIVLSSSEPSVTLCFLDEPIDFSAIDGRPVHTFFSMITHTIRSHLYLLARLAAALSDSGFKGAVLARAPLETVLAEAERVEKSLEVPRSTQ